jgi:LuxR family maltose regulon positive regulatory protein
LWFWVHDQPMQALTSRELGILKLLTSDLSEREIGRELFVSHNTVHGHVRSIYRKLGVSSRVGAVERSRELGLMSESPQFALNPRPGDAGPAALSCDPVELFAGPGPAGPAHFACLAVVGGETGCLVAA